MALHTAQLPVLENRYLDGGIEDMLAAVMLRHHREVE